MVRDGNVTPASPSSRARAPARSIVAWRQESASRAAAGATYLSLHGQSKSLQVPERVPVVPTAGQPLAGIARCSARIAACTT
jgi:hypothetical protein